MSTVETHAFQTEVKQLLQLMIHALYSNQEIFLRELISNSSDALDKLRFEGLSNDSLYEEDDSELGIWVDYDKDNLQLTIRDNGIGMTREEVVANIGTIASSGTKKFLENLTGDQAKDSHLIGQFGVGFYSAFIVADKVTVETRRAGEASDSAVRWESTGDGEFTLESIDQSVRGTTITLHLKEDCGEFAERFRLQNIIKTYSNHLSFDVYLPKEETDDEGNSTKTDDWEKANEAGAMWTQPKSELKEEDYHEFYKSLGYDWQDPLAYSHNQVEGTSEYTSLLYIPKTAPFDLWDRERRYGLKLYVKRVFIMDDAENLLPTYLRFVRGLIDSDDLPLNVSREILQSNKVVTRIKTATTKKILGMIESMAKADDQSDFNAFWDTYGQVMKEGAVEDYTNKDRIAKLLRFVTTASESDEQRTGLEAYVARMNEGQEAIYYVTAETLAAAKGSPHLEAFRKAGVEVLLLSDRIDEWLVSHLTEFDEKPLKSITRGDLDSFIKDKIEEEVSEEDKEKGDDLTKRITDALGDKVKEVRVTYRLVDSPACLVADENDMNANMQRILAQMGQDAPDATPIMEINPSHPLVKRMESLSDDDAFADWSQLLLDQASLAEGAQLADPADFVKRMNKLLSGA